MKVRIYPVENGFVVADDGGWVPGTYPTERAAARAAWNMQDHGTPDDQPEERAVRWNVCPDCFDSHGGKACYEEPPCPTT